MIKKFKQIKWKTYCNLSDQLTELLPEEFEPVVEIAPPVKGDKDLVIITFKIPRKLTHKLIWHFKSWRKS